MHPAKPESIQPVEWFKGRTNGLGSRLVRCAMRNRTWPEMTVQFRLGLSFHRRLFQPRFSIVRTFGLPLCNCK